MTSPINPLSQSLLVALMGLPAAAAQQGPAARGIGTPVCPAGITDAATGGCISASSTPALGELYPLGPDLFVDGSGYVGIGTTAPTSRLHVAGDLRLAGTLRYPNGTTPLSYLFESGTSNPPRALCAHSPAYPTWGIFYEDVGDSVVFQSDARQALKVALGTGKVGLSNAAPTRLLHVGTTTGDGIAIGSVEYVEDGGSNTLLFNSDLVPAIDGFWWLGNDTACMSAVWAYAHVTCSDARAKTDIRDAQYGLKEVMQLRPVSYTFRGREEDGPQVGLVAQEVLPVVREAVATHHYERDEATGARRRVENERLGIDYGALVPVVIKAVQEQQDIIVRQQSLLRSLEQRLAALEAR